jgi:hypothetical protein
MTGYCNKHPFEKATAACRSCAEMYCGDCLVYANGPEKPPYCVSCGLVVAGVRRLTAQERRTHRMNRRRVAAVVAAEPVEVIDELGPPNHLTLASKGRSRLGLLAVSASLVVVLVPLIQHYV